MRAEPTFQCPRCGGRDQKDLTRIRRATGAVLTGGSLTAVLALGASGAVLPSWILPALGVVFLVGLVALVGANRARYCPKCNLRMAPTPMEPPSGGPPSGGPAPGGPPLGGPPLGGPPPGGPPPAEPPLG